MNYFTALLLAAGLPTSFTAMPHNAIVAPTSAPTAWSLTTRDLAFQTKWMIPSKDSKPNLSTVSPSASSSAPTTAQVSHTATPQVPPSVSTSPSTAPVTSSPRPSTPKTSTPASSATATGNSAQTMISLINQARSKAGLTPYTVNSSLSKLAQERAVALANGPFTSDLAGYGWPVQMEQAAGIQAQGLGAENIAEASSVSQAFSLLMASPPHRSNILNPSETQIGVGVAPWGSGVAISELFIGPNA